MAIILAKITPEQHTSAVDWIRDAFCYWDNIDTLTAQQSYRVVQRHYEGGWGQFVADSEGVQL